MEKGNTIKINRSLWTAKFVSIIVQVMARLLSEDEIEGLRQLFKTFDKDHSGTITLGELENGLYEVGSESSKEELAKIMKAADVDKNGEYIMFCEISLTKRGKS